MSGSHWISEGGTTFFLAPTGGSSGSTKVTHSLTPPPKVTHSSGSYYTSAAPRSVTTRPILLRYGLASDPATPQRHWSGTCLLEPVLGQRLAPLGAVGVLNADQPGWPGSSRRSVANSQTNLPQAKKESARFMALCPGAQNFAHPPTGLLVTVQNKKKCDNNVYGIPTNIGDLDSIRNRSQLSTSDSPLPHRW